jgi:hypothetical protein
VHTGFWWEDLREMGGISRLAEHLFASQEGLCSMELVI